MNLHPTSSESASNILHLIQAPETTDEETQEEITRAYRGRRTNKQNKTKQTNKQPNKQGQASCFQSSVSHRNGKVTHGEVMHQSPRPTRSKPHVQRANLLTSNALRAKATCHFRCASRFGRVPLFEVASAKSAPSMKGFYDLDFQMCFAPRPHVKLHLMKVFRA